MVYLRLDGMDVPIAADDTEEMPPEEIGTKGRAYGGDMLSDRRALKRGWQESTTYVKELFAIAIKGIIHGLGESFPFDIDLFSSKGLASLTGSSIASIRIATAADGDPVIDEASVSESMFGAGSVAVEAATTNILTANQSNAETDTTGFTSLDGAVLAVDTGEQVEGAQALKVTTNAVDEGVEVLATASASTIYSASVYIKVDSARSIQINLTDDTGFDNDTTQLTMQPDIWYRIELTLLLDGAATQAILQITEDNAGGGDFWVDQLQIEQNIAATSWVVGQGSRTIGDLEYKPNFLFGATDMTYNAWVRMPTADTTVDRTLFNANGPGNDNRFKVERQANMNNIRFQTRDDNSSDNIGGSLVNLWDGTWHMVTCVMRANPELGEFNKTIYFDGAVVVTGNTVNLPDLAKLACLEVGSRANGRQLWPGLQDDTRVLPYAASPEMITGWFNFGFSTANLPRILLDGEIVPDSPGKLLVEGEVGTVAHVGVQLDGEFKTNAQLIEFKLKQV